MEAVVGLLCRAALAAIAALLAAQAGAAQLVRDINAVPIATGAPASHWTGLGSTTLFLMDDGIHGEELWRTDGTPSGTTIVMDINPGPATSGITAMTVVGDLLYFFANDGTNGQELWRSDGTTAGTRIVADINAGPGDGATGSVSTPLFAVRIPVVNSVLYFTGTDATSGAELWRSDGTAAGTYRLADLCSGSCDSAPNLYAVGDARLFFTAYEPGTGIELYVSDGTVAGTKRVSDIRPGSSSSDPSRLTVTSAGVFFTADDGTRGRELWFSRADGSEASLVVDLSPGTPSSSYSPMGVIGADVVFGAAAFGGNPPGLNFYRASSSEVQVLAQRPQSGADDSLGGQGFVSVGGRLVFEARGLFPNGEVWVTDGTAAGTHRLGAASGLYSTTLFNVPGDLGGVSGSDGYYFLGYTGAPGNGVDLWRTDGTDAGTVRYALLPQPFNASSLAQLNGRIYFAGGRFGSNGWELWSTDGTAGGTAEVADLNPGPADSVPGGMIVVGGRLHFVAANTDGPVPWASDGTATGTVALHATGSATRSASSEPQWLVRLGSRVVFVADDGVHGNEPWVSDGTSAGTTLLRDVAAGTGGSSPGMFASLVSRQLFAANDGAHGNELWATDGTPAGTYLVSDIYAGPGSGNPASTTAAVLNNVAYFPASDGTPGAQLWRSDGTESGTFLVLDLSPGTPGSISDMQVLNGLLLFRYQSGAGAYWWASDGTAVGTRLVTNAASPVGANQSVIMNGFLYFAGQAAPVVNADHVQLWRTDGTAVGTTQVSNLAPGASITGIETLRAMPGHVLFWFCYNDGTAACGLYSSDGTTAGTELISPDGIGGDSAVLGNQLIYTANDPAGPWLRITDGTAAGTRNVLDAPAPLNFGSFALVQGHLLFTQVDPLLGPSVWRTDGTAASTVLVADIDPGIDTQYVPYGFTSVGNRLFFQAYAPRTGAELYVLDVATPNASEDFASVANGGSVDIHVLANDGTISGVIAPSSVNIETAASNGSTSVDQASGTVSYTPAAGFAGSDEFTYTVSDAAGHVSAAATVHVSVAQPAGPSPGTAPAPPPPPSGGGSTGGGGGAMSVLHLALLLALLGVFTVARRRSSATVRVNARARPRAAPPPGP